MFGLNALQLVAYATLLSGFATVGFLISRDSRKPRHDPANDNADFDPRLVKLGRRVGFITPFHDSNDSPEGPHDHVA